MDLLAPEGDSSGSSELPTGILVLIIVLCIIILTVVSVIVFIIFVCYCRGFYYSNIG